MVEVLLGEVVVNLEFDIIEAFFTDPRPDMQRRIVVVRNIDLDKFRSRRQPITLRIGLTVEFGNAFLLPRYPGVFCIQRLAQLLRLLDSLVYLCLIAVPQFRHLLLVVLYNGGAFSLQLRYLLVFGYKVSLCFGKVAFTYPRQKDILSLVGFPHFGIQSGNIVLVLQHLLPIVLAVGVVFGRRDDNATL